jgi:hypothetical protein
MLAPSTSAGRPGVRGKEILAVDLEMRLAVSNRLLTLPRRRMHTSKVQVHHVAVRI